MTARHVRTFTLLALAASTATAQSLLPNQGQVVAAVGDAPIGTPAGATIGNSGPFDNAVLDLDGNLLFRARLVGGTIGALNDRALYYGRTSADLRLIAQAGGPDPSGIYPGATLNSSTVSTQAPLGSGLSSSYRTNGGFLLFPAYMNGGGLISGPTVGARNDSFLFWGTPNGVTILAQKNVTTMPGGGVIDNTLASLGQQITALGSDGTAVFYATLEDLPLGTTDVTSDNNAAFVFGTPGNLAYLVRKGDTLLGGQVAIGQLGLNCQRNDLGQVLHDQTLSQSLGSVPATAANDKVVLVTTAGVHGIVMREGDQAAGAAVGAFYGSPTLAQGFGNSGRTAFTGSLTGAVTTDDDLAVWEGGVGNVQLVAREGGPAPGTAGGETFASFFGGSLSYSDASGTVFTGTVAGGSVTTANDAGIWAGHPGSVQLIAREGDAAPGTSGVFGSSGGAGFGSGTALTTNERGQITMLCNVLDGGVTYAALYTYDPLHGLQLQLLGNTSSGGDSFGANPNTQGVTGISAPLQFPSNGGSVLGFSNHGDFAIRPAFLGSNLTAIVRGHVGSLQGTPSAVPVTGGVPHTLAIDCTPAYGLQFYIVLATGTGTSPGFPNPLNPLLNVPLNFDPVWSQLSFDLANSVVWGNSLFLTDPSGKAVATFTMPPGYPGFLGTSLHHAAALFDTTLTGTFVTEPVGCLLY